MSPRAQAAHGFLIKNDMSLWASDLADLSKSVRFLTPELEAVDRGFYLPFVFSAAAFSPASRPKVQARLWVRPGTVVG
jgi:hypothetical protein